MAIKCLPSVYLSGDSRDRGISEKSTVLIFCAIPALILLCTVFLPNSRRCDEILAWKVGELYISFLGQQYLKILCLFMLIVLLLWLFSILRNNRTCGVIGCWIFLVTYPVLVGISIMYAVCGCMSFRNSKGHDDDDVRLCAYRAVIYRIVGCLVHIGCAWDFCAVNTYVSKMK